MSGGSSSQAQTETFTDNRLVQGEGAMQATGGSTLTNTTTNYVLDGGTIDKSFEFADGIGSAALDSVSRGVTAALNFGSDALGFGEAALQQNTRTTTAALNFADSAFDGALSSNNKALTGAFNFGSDALALTESAYDRALDFSSTITDSAFNQMSGTQQLVANAYNDAKGRGALTDKIIMGAIAAMALVAYMSVKK